jgi:MFS family permease
VIRPRLWTKDFLTICFLHFFIALNFCMLMVIMSIFATDTFHSSPSEAGLCAGIFVVGTLIARLFSGKWIERAGRKKTLYAGLILSLVMTLLYFKIPGILFLLAIRFLHGAGFGIASTAASTIVANIIPKERAGEGLGYFLLSNALAMAVGPFLGMFISQHGSFHMIFVASAVFAAVGLVNASFLSVPEINLTKQQWEATRGFNVRSFFEPKAVPISIVCGIIAFCYSSVFSFLTAYSREIHLIDTASFFFIVYAVVMFISRPQAGRLFDRKGENAVMLLGILIFVVGLIILSQAHEGYVLLLAAAFIGVGFGSVSPIGQAVSVKVTPLHRTGLAVSTFWMFFDIGTGAGPFVFGLLITFTGYRRAYLCMAIVAFASIFLYYKLHGRRVEA